MKKLVTIFVLALVALSAAAQKNTLMAEMEWENAEKAYSERRYFDALNHLDKTQEYAGWLPAISHLRIVCWDITQCTSWGKEDLAEEVKRYMDYADKNANDVIRDHFRDVYAFSQKLEARADLNEGNTLYNAGEYAQAFPKLRVAAENGWLGAMMRLAAMYSSGRGVSQDKDEALRWMQLVEDKGYDANAWLKTILGNQM